MYTFNNHNCLSQGFGYTANLLIVIKKNHYVKSVNSKYFANSYVCHEPRIKDKNNIPIKTNSW